MADSESTIVQLYHDILDFVYPPLCLGCGVRVEGDVQICESCHKRIETYDRPWCLTCQEVVHRGSVCPVCHDKGFLLFSYGDYREPMAEIIKQLKFKGITYPARYFSSLIADRLGPQIEALDPDRLVPIPLHRSREYTRGYNQAMLVAEVLSQRLHVPVDDELLRRDKARRPQAKLLPREREKNISGVFRVTETCTTRTRLILVDDVVTTGSTVNEARNALCAAGYEVPAVIAIAK